MGGSVILISPIQVSDGVTLQYLYFDVCLIVHIFH